MTNQAHTRTTVLRRGWSAGSARSLLSTVLGELVVPSGEPMWTGSLLHVLAGLGITEQAGRQAITRAADSGWIAAEKRGRAVLWSVTDLGTRITEDVTQRALSLSAAPQRWDGNCLILNVSVPQEKKAVRKRLYSALGYAGYGNPAPGLWASPHVDRLEETRRLIRELDLEDSTIAFIGSTVQVGLTDRVIVERAWNLDDVADRYASALATFKDLEPEPGDELLLAYVAVAHEWRGFPYMDPQLPHDLLPNWIGRRAVEALGCLRRMWSPGARRRWQEVVEATSPAA